QQNAVTPLRWRELRRNAGALFLEVPGHVMHARGARPVERRQRLAARVGYSETRVAARARRQTVHYVRAVRRVGEGDLRLAVAVAGKVRLRCFAPLIRRLGLE